MNGGMLNELSAIGRFHTLFAWYFKPFPEQSKRVFPSTGIQSTGVLISAGGFGIVRARLSELLLQLLVLSRCSPPIAPRLFLQFPMAFPVRFW